VDFFAWEVVGDTLGTSLHSYLLQWVEPKAGSRRLHSSSLTLLSNLFPPQSNGSRDMGGYLCYSCVQKRFGSMTPLAFLPALQEEPIVL